MERGEALNKIRFNIINYLFKTLTEIDKTLDKIWLKPNFDFLMGLPRLSGDPVARL